MLKAFNEGMLNRSAQVILRNAPGPEHNLLPYTVLNGRGGGAIWPWGQYDEVGLGWVVK